LSGRSAAVKRARSTAAVSLRARLAQLALEAGDAVRVVHADPLQSEHLGPRGEPLVGRGSAEIAGGAHRCDRLGVVAARRVAEEVDRLVEALLEVLPGPGDLLPQL